jgi:putative glutamate/gamma-aminobutyrate antiporter
MSIALPRSRKVLSVFSLVMINIIAVDSLRSLPISAEYGFSIVFFYILGALLFLIPTALVAAELATGWPQTGGIYVWLREAFGKRAGFAIIWLQWLYNVVWYPTIMSLLAATLAYLFDPQLAQNKAYMLTMILLLFWGATFANWFGMKISSWVSTIAALVGTLVPMVFIIVLAIIWVCSGKPVHVDFSWHGFFPKFENINSFALLSVVLFGLIGMEMSAVHAGDVKNPQRDYPRALFISAIIIIITLTLGSLAIAIVIPQNEIQLTSGLMEGFSVFFNTFHMKWLIPVIAVLIIIGGFGGVSAWVIGPTKGIMVAAEDGAAPKFLQSKNQYGVPAKILIIQGIITSILSCAFVLMPNINSAFSLLSAMTSQVALLVYLGIFAAAIKLRFSKPEVPRAFKVPGGKIGLILIAGAAMLTCLVVFALGFLPPTQINVGHVWLYETILVSGTLLICVPPFLFSLQANKKS